MWPGLTKNGLSVARSDYISTVQYSGDSVWLVNIIRLQGVLLCQPSPLIFQYRLVRECAVLSFLSSQLPIRDLDREFLRQTVLVEL